MTWKEVTTCKYNAKTFVELIIPIYIGYEQLLYHSKSDAKHKTTQEEQQNKTLSCQMIATNLCCRFFFYLQCLL